MDRRFILFGLGLVLALAVVAISGVYIGNRLATAPTSSASKLTSQQVLNLAKSSIPALQLPPQPSGQQVTKLVAHNVQVAVPVTTCDQQSGPFGVKFCIPKVEMVTHTVTQSEPETALINASPDEVSKWQQETRTAETQYRNNLDAKIREIETQQTAQSQTNILQSGESLVKDTIIPLITALTGLISAVVLLYRGYNAGK